MRPFPALTLAASLAGIGYLAFALVRVRKFERRATGSPQATPPVTILKPLFGAQPRLAECLRSFCEQDYPEFQIVFGVADPADPAAEIARALIAQYPERDLHLVTGGAHHARNRKVANLANMFAAAKHDVIALADADIRAGNDYLRAIVAGLEAPNAGAVTCLYGADAGTAVAAQLAALHVEERFAPSVLVAQAVEPLRYAFGATIALRRAVLEEIGGLEALADNVADDHLLGRLVADTGREVVLSRYVVHTVASECDLFALWAREVRWARTIRAVRPAGWAGNVVSYALPLALLAFVAKPRCRRRQVALALTWLLRLRLHAVCRRTFAGTGPRPLRLVPLRDLLDLAIWLASFAGSEVRWGGEQLTLEPGGRIGG